MPSPCVRTPSGLSQATRGHRQRCNCHRPRTVQAPRIQPVCLQTISTRSSHTFHSYTSAGLLLPRPRKRCCGYGLRWHVLARTPSRGAVAIAARLYSLHVDRRRGTSRVRVSTTRQQCGHPLSPTSHRACGDGGEELVPTVMQCIMQLRNLLHTSIWRHTR